MRRRWKERILKRKRAVAIAAALVLIVLCVPWAFLRTPGWYDPPNIAPQNRQQVRNNLLAAEQAFTETLRANLGPFAYHLHQDDLNQWLTMRREIYPLIDEMLPANISGPFVVFDDDTITLAVRYSVGAAVVVLSLDLDVTFQDNGLLLQASGARCGSVPVPLSFAGLGLEQPIRIEPGDAWPGSPLIAGDLSRGLRIEANATWANGGLDYRVIDAWVGPKMLTFKVEAVESHDRSAWNHQP